MKFRSFLNFLISEKLKNPEYVMSTDTACNKYHGDGADQERASYQAQDGCSKTAYLMLQNRIPDALKPHPHTPYAPKSHPENHIPAPPMLQNRIRKTAYSHALCSKIACPMLQNRMPYAPKSHPLCSKTACPNATENARKSHPLCSKIASGKSHPSIPKIAS